MQWTALEARLARSVGTEASSPFILFACAKEFNQDRSVRTTTLSDVLYTQSVNTKSIYDAEMVEHT